MDILKFVKSNQKEDSIGWFYISSFYGTGPGFNSWPQICSQTRYTKSWWMNFFLANFVISHLVNIPDLPNCIQFWPWVSEEILKVFYTDGL